VTRLVSDSRTNPSAGLGRVLFFQGPRYQDRLHGPRRIENRTAQVVRAKIFVSQCGFEFFLDEELPSAATLSGLQFNISGIVGPALGGLLVSVAGANFVFALNAACFLLVVLGIRQWKQRSAPPKLPSEGFFESFGTVISYARNTSNFQVVLALFSPRND
jgi:Transmembrane secretion effector